jgi:hypothetical protein
MVGAGLSFEKRSGNKKTRPEGRAKVMLLVRNR